MTRAVHDAKVDSIRPLAAEVYEYVLSLSPSDADLAWRSGQFISLSCGERSPGKPLLRSYSIANRSGEHTVHLVIKLIDGGAASEWFRALRPGAEVRFTGPMGFFVLDAQHAGDVIFAATGTGIAPIRPMLEEVLERDEAGRVHLFWGLRSEEDLFWVAELDALASRSERFQAHLHVTRGSERWSGSRGRITLPLLELAPTLVAPTFYLCGNGEMIREVRAALVERGFDRKRQVHTEAFF